MSEEDDWYRMAIHHTAGNQDTGGSVKEQVQWLQVFFQESRGYCDIAYQFLVGRDGSIWEGRPYDYYSAATGGNQNNGNMAISFMGCYDSQVCGGSSYPGPHVPSETMIDNVHDLIYTISQVEDIPTDSDHIKGHNDWPGNNTACPGDTIEERIPDWFVPPGPDYAASLVESGFPLADEAAIVLKIGETIEGYLEFENTGRSDWTAMTRVATLPRNEASPVYGDEWIEPHRAVAGDTNAAPGETARFSFSLKGREAGVYYQDFTLVQEGIKWFEDDGGVTPEEITLRIVVDDEEVVTDSGSLNDSSDPDYTRTPVSELGACACTSTPRRDALFPGLLALLGSILIRRRR